MNKDQWIRKISLTVESSTSVLDLSAMHIRFNTKQSDTETPNNATIRIYNLKKETLHSLIEGGEYTDVTLQAGYQGDSSNYGKIFTGQIRQYRIGRENSTDSYLDILAADGDTWYNQSFINTSSSKGINNLQALSKIANDSGLPLIATLTTDKQHYTIPRGSVEFGMSKARFRERASNLDAAWSIQNGQIVLHDNTGYVGNEALVLNAATGLIGVPEQTNEGIVLQCLLNSRIRLGGLIKVNNDEINQIQQSNPNSPANLAYNLAATVQQNAFLSGSGVYQAFVVEHEGDTRGQMWYSHLICLATNQTQNLVPGGV